MRVDLDLETTGLDWQHDKIILNGFRVDFDNIRYAPPLGVDSYLFDLLSDDRNELWGHNIKFDALFLAQAGYEIKCDLIDTKVMAFACWPQLEEHGLKSLCETKLGRKYERTLGDMVFRPNREDLRYLAGFESHYYKLLDGWARRDHVDYYHKEDVYNIERISAIMVPPNWFYEVEVPLTKILFDTELLGIKLDVQRLKDIQTPVKQRIDELQLKFGAMNPNSTDQIGEQLQRLGVDLRKIPERTPTGKPKIDKIYLKRRVWDVGCDFTRDILEHRALSKINGTYLERFIGVNQGDGRLRGSFNQAGRSDDALGGTKTGRLTSADPNLQNIPSRTKLGKQVRSAFIATPGWDLYDSDLPQIEPRLIGHFSQSKKLIDAYNKGLDTHGLFARDVFGPAFSPTQRFIGKTGWLATAYGCSPQKLLTICETYSDDPLDINFKGYEAAFYALPKVSKWLSQEKLQKQYGEYAPVIYSKWEFFKDFQRKFIESNPEIWGWRNAVINRAREAGYIRTIGGRLIRIEGLDSSNRAVKARAERTAINYLIQGSAADIFKQLTLGFNKLLESKGARFLAFIHDEWLLESRKLITNDEWQGVVDKIVKLQNVPLPLEISKINNWAEKK